MMEVREFQEKLEQVMNLAMSHDKNLTNEEILNIFGLNQLSTAQLQSLYEYLKVQGIRDSERRTNHCSLSIERRMKKNRVVIRCADTNFWAVFPPQI